MAKQIEKKIVPPRDERMEDIGAPKPPKMGGVTPTKVKLPEVDDLLEKMDKATAPKKRSLFDPRRWGFASFDMERGYGLCHINCKCLPCLQGRCDGCHVERLRDNPDRELVRAAVTQYRGVVFQ